MFNVKIPGFTMLARWIPVASVLGFSAGGGVALGSATQCGHGFGMLAQGLPSDHWIDAFYGWLVAQDIIVRAARS